MILSSQIISSALALVALATTLVSIVTLLAFAFIFAKSSHLSRVYIIIICLNTANHN